MIFHFSFIPGLMFGIEFPSDFPQIHMVLDLGILRLIVASRDDYDDYDEDS